MIYTKYDDYLLYSFINETYLGENTNMRTITNFVKKVNDKAYVLRKAIQSFNRTNSEKIKRRLSLIILLLAFPTLMSSIKSEDEGITSKVNMAVRELISSSADNHNLTQEDLERIRDKYLIGPKEYKTHDIIKTTPSMIMSLNRVAPGRFSLKYKDTYDKYDKDILEAVKELRAAGEDPDPNIIKSIMLIETGMNPRKNSLGYEGFPQTKKRIVDYINSVNGTHFTMEDMYNAKEAAKFIYYYLKTLSKSKHISNTEDLLIAYNWGIGNLSKYKKGEKELPDESKDYVALFNTLSHNAI